ncbi:hypothetical protein ACN2XU_05245 [Primorskyibacter sp. 2E107]|uniref:hypothetical protein n=1 Tax=Primorskyibacter sp. 2E107 TaxID=3403458 RepID=UPI003AF464B6
MPLLRISASETGPALHGATAPLLPTLRHALAADPGPITIMIHGYKYLPGDPVYCPFIGILAGKPRQPGGRVLSWPRHLGLRGQRGEGLGICFGWAARGTIRQAWHAAESAGGDLAVLLNRLRALTPARPIHIVGHSLGVRVALSALRSSPPGTVRTLIALAAADFENHAEQALAAAGPALRLLNVTSRENDLFDFLLERSVPAPGPKARMLGFGALRHPGLVTVQLDDVQTLAALRRLGFPVAPPLRRVCHWSPYLRPGVFPLYRALLHDRLDWTQLRHGLPTQPAPRWSGLSLRLPRRFPGKYAQSPAIGQI